MSDTIVHAALTRMHMRDVAILPSYSGTLADLQALARATPTEVQAALMDGREARCASFGLDGAGQRKPFAFSGGIAIIPVSGTLINRFGSSWSYVTGYNFIRSQVAAAVADPDVLGILLDVNSYGGEAAGCFECSQFIRGPGRQAGDGLRRHQRLLRRLRDRQIAY